MLIGPWKTRICLTQCTLALAILSGAKASGQNTPPPDPLMELFIQKGMLTREEVDRVRGEAEAMRTNAPAQSQAGSKWNISKGLKSVELFGDIRLRYEHRQAETPPGDRIDLDRERLAVRVGLRGELLDNFYYGLRLETSSNPRSPWVTLGASTPEPFGKSNLGIAVGQAYLGWRPGEWGDLTVGKMPNPLYTTSMVWDPDLNPEGAAERFKYSVGQADFFANFGQFIYQDNNPSFISGSLLLPSGVSNGSRTQESTDQTFLLAWQGGVNYHITQDVSVKAGPTLYNYIGLVPTTSLAAGVSPNAIGDTFIGEGSYGGPNSSAPVNGLTSQNGISYNQVGLNNLLVLDVPMEVNFKLGRQLNGRVFGDYAYNLEGSDRATAAVSALSAAVGTTGAMPPLLAAGPQRNDIHAYQVGFALGNVDNLGMVYGTTSRKHGWEARTYWQHVEQYALDPNLLDSDFFEGRGNLEGIYTAFSYGFTDNVLGTVRYGHARRINNKLGTGGSNLDIPQINPIQFYDLVQLDLTLKF